MVMTSENLADGIKDAFTPLLRAIVEHSDRISVDVSVSPNRTVFVHFHAHQEDRGFLIGREGKTAHALRQLLTNYCGRWQHRVVLEIVE